ncbi:DUF1127 domain-containing protein [Roseomonas aerophila]|uniref:DUF1127 domain-containing protein n=1 Tax=Teichococcus aerophilus TaxID=1224513 RepID=A0ABR7RI05_9PROT|nr:DUF1127 domain-containing protein [Pseudoroseomonas aerophila]MBC9206063.1 DUF1127 domain-containing protein [Pseudoroseomonas aerophila]
MDARFTTSSANAAAIELVRQDAIRERDAKIGQWFRNAFRAIAEYPRRRRVMDELSMLTDRELADIGLSRGDIRRVFDMQQEEQRPTATIHTLPKAPKGQTEVTFQSSRIAA